MATERSGYGLYERETELERLHVALDVAVAGEGQLLLIQGSPGIGKTRLLNALCERARPMARTVLRGRGGEQERELPLSVVRELFEPVVMRAAADERMRLFAGSASLALPLLDQPHAGDAAAPDTAFAMMHGLYWLTVNLAETGPVVFAVDDAHWADEATQRWLAYLIPRIDELQVLLALTVRPLEIDPASRLARAIATHGDLTVIEPTALTEDGTAEIVRDIIGDADPAFCSAVWGATGGNPLLVRTLVSALGASGVEPTARNADRVHTLGAGKIGRIVLPRLHRLGRHAVELARAAAVLGESATLADAVALARLEPAAGPAAATALVTADVLQRDSSAFTHPLVRAIVLDELDASTRAELHYRAAKRLAASGASAESTARHLLMAAPTAEPWALSALRDAARVAAERGALQTAVTFLERGLREHVDPPDRTKLLFELGTIAFKARDERAVPWLKSAADEADELGLRIRAEIALVTAAGLMGTRPSTDTLYEMAPQANGDLAYAVSAILLADYGYTSSGGGPRHKVLVRPGELPVGVTPAERTWLATSAFRAVMECVSAQRAVELAERALASGTLLTESADDWAFIYAATALLFGSGPTRAIAEYDRGTADAVRRGSVTAYERFSAHRARAHVQRGNLAEAEADVLAAIEVESELGWNLGTPAKLATLVDICRERGALDRAEAVLAERDLLNEQPPPSLHGAYLLESRGRLRLAHGKVPEALADFDSCHRCLAGFGTPRSAAFSWRAHAALCHKAQGAHDVAERLATDQVEDARSFGQPRWHGSSLRALGVVRGGTEGIALLADAVTVLERAEAHLEHAHALCDLGILLRHNRRPREAREPLLQAQDLAIRCGADALANRASEELSATGARPRRRAITGADSLTPAERRVASLAAQGMTNPEIAQSLFITRKTVEKHLGNAYLKLQVTARGELAVALYGGVPPR